MSGYRCLSWNYTVPEEWPVDSARPVLEDLLEKVTSHHKLSDKVVITIEGVSALVVNQGLQFLFEKIEEINDDYTHIIDFLLPERALIIKLKNGRPVYSERKEVYDIIIYKTQDHPFSELFEWRSDRHIIVTAATDIRKIFEAHGIKTEEMYNYALETIYKTHKGLEPGPRRIIKPEAKGHSFMTVTKIADDHWELKCYERLTRSRSVVTSCFTPSICS